MELNIKNHLEKLRKNIFLDDQEYETVISVDRLYEHNGEIYTILSGEITSEEIRKYDEQIFNSDSFKNINGQEMAIFYFGFQMKLSAKDIFNIFPNYEIFENDYHVLFNLKTSDKKEYQRLVKQEIMKINGLSFGIEISKKNGTKATFSFSASPSIYIKGKIRFTEKKVIIENTFPTIFDNHYKNQKEKPYFEIIPESIDVYNVGQGCLSIINCQLEKIMFDIGITYSEKTDKKEFEFAKDAIKNFSGNLVIISHTDYDHVKGLAFADPIILEKTWFLPYKIHDSLYAKRLICHLIKNNTNNTFIVDKTYELSKNIKLFVGDGTNHKFCNSKNASGLICELHNENNFALLPGDCIYSSMPTCLHKDFNFLLVPHHCCELEDDYIDAFLGPCNKYAIVSCGENSYGHPNKNHINRLMKNYIVVTTDSLLNSKYEYDIVLDKLSIVR